jgi:hypothetical protein
MTLEELKEYLITSAELDPTELWPEDFPLHDYNIITLWMRVSSEMKNNNDTNANTTNHTTNHTKTKDPLLPSAEVATAAELDKKIMLFSCKLCKKIIPVLGTNLMIELASHLRNSHGDVQINPADTTGVRQYFDEEKQPSENV